MLPDRAHPKPGTWPGDIARLLTLELWGEIWFQGKALGIGVELQQQPLNSWTLTFAACLLKKNIAGEYLLVGEKTLSLVGTPSVLKAG